MKHKIFSYYISKDLCWFKIYKWGISISREPLRFSERNGYTKYLKLPFGWRATIMPNWNITK